MFLSSKLVCNIDSLRATLVERERNGRVSRFVSAHFEADGIYKSVVCRLAEECGCRYVSHRRGYVFSLRAWHRFCADLAANEARYRNPRLVETLKSIRRIRDAA